MLIRCILQVGQEEESGDDMDSSSEEEDEDKGDGLFQQEPETQEEEQCVPCQREATTDADMLLPGPALPLTAAPLMQGSTTRRGPTPVARGAI